MLIVTVHDRNILNLIFYQVSASNIDKYRSFTSRYYVCYMYYQHHHEYYMHNFDYFLDPYYDESTTTTTFRTPGKYMSVTILLLNNIIQPF